MANNGSYDNKIERLKKYKYRRIFVIGIFGRFLCHQFFDTPEKARDYLQSFCNFECFSSDAFDILSFEVRV